jgi:hypothetical protein
MHTRVGWLPRSRTSPWTDECRCGTSPHLVSNIHLRLLCQRIDYHQTHMSYICVAAEGPPVFSLRHRGTLLPNLCATLAITPVLVERRRRGYIPEAGAYDGTLPLSSRGPSYCYNADGTHRRLSPCLRSICLSQDFKHECFPVKKKSTREEEGSTDPSPRCCPHSPS